MECRHQEPRSSSTRRRRGNAPWHNGDWPGYAGSLARAARRIAELAAPFGDKVAYQIWNEGDSDPTNPSAIGVSPENFAPVLQQTAAAIRAVDPDATIVFGGLNTGPENAVAYARRVRDLLGVACPSMRWPTTPTVATSSSTRSMASSSAGWTTRCAFSNRRSPTCPCG